MVKLFANLSVERGEGYVELVEYSFCPYLGTHHLWFGSSRTTVTSKSPGKIVSALSNHEGVDYRSCPEVCELIEWLIA